MYSKIWINLVHQQCKGVFLWQIFIIGELILQVKRFWFYVGLNVFGLNLMVQNGSYLIYMLLAALIGQWCVVGDFNMFKDIIDKS